MTTRRRFRLRLAAVCLLGLVLQAVFRWLEWGANPLARVPLDDAEVYWDWAGAIAGGRLVGPEPFLSAPLYPYLLGLLRALGFGLPGVIAVQALLQAATAWLLGGVARAHLLRPSRTLDPDQAEAPGVARAESFALLAALLFLLLSDPAYAVGRLLNSSLQLLLLVALWRQSQLCVERDSPLRDAALGALAGLNVLANPAMLLAVPLLVLWRCLDGRRTVPPRILMLLAPALLVILPATIHNALACGEGILVSAQAGVTLSHGNADGADGTYHPIPGVSTGRMKQNRDAFRLAAEATGEESWRGTSAHFRDRAVQWWLDHPGEALVLLGRKFALFFGASRSGDVALPGLEREAGLKPWSGLLPPPLLLTPAALLLAVALWRRRAGFVELLLFLLPLFVVCLFFYSPRYRLPALPVAAVVVAAGLARHPRLTAAGLGAGLLVWFGGGKLEPAVAGLRPAFEQKLGQAFEQEGNLQAAAKHYRQAVDLGFAPAAASLGHVLDQLGGGDEALAMLRRTAEEQPDSVHARRALAVALAERGLYPEAETEYRAALALDAEDWESLSGLGNVLARLGRATEAEEKHRAALAARPEHGPSWFNFGSFLVEQDRGDEAVAALEEAFRLGTDPAAGYVWLARLLAVSSDDSVRDLQRAKAMAQEAERRLRPETEPDPSDAGPDPQLVVELKTAWATIHAAEGDFGSAAAALDDAASYAEKKGAPEALVTQLRADAAALRNRRQ